MVKKRVLQVGLLVLGVIATLPITTGVASAQATTTSKCINGKVTVAISGRPTVTYPCSTTEAGIGTQAVERGFIEICKDTAPVTAGTFFSFSVQGPGTVRDVSVPSGACSPPIQVGAGQVTITEEARESYRLCNVSTEPASRLVGSNLPARTGTVRVPAGDVSTQTIVFFKNCEQGRLKLCKVAGPNVPIGHGFIMTVTPTNPAGPSVSFVVPAGPRPGGFCILSGVFDVGTRVRVTEPISKFFVMDNIAFSVQPPNRFVSYTPESDQATTPASVVVNIGSGVTEVSLTNQCMFPSSSACAGGFPGGI